MNEIDEALFTATAEWCVYLHSRPNGEVFYVGKGRRHRARDFAPSRRTQYHKNVVEKYGRENIGIQVIPCASETEAKLLECIHIKMRRDAGVRLVNLTNGGEGRSGHVPTPKQAEALKSGRGRQAYARLAPESKRRILDGLARGRAKHGAWLESPEGQEQMRRLAIIGTQALHCERKAVCVQCNEAFVTRSAKARCCSRRCEQRHRRAAEVCK